MNKAVHTSAIVFGMCVMFASLCSGCATQIDPNRVPMSTVDLNHFQIDCRIKEQQVAMLQSMRQSNQDIFASKLRSMAQPFSWGTDHDIAHGNVNGYLDYHLNQLGYCR